MLWVAAFESRELGRTKLVRRRGNAGVTPELPPGQRRGNGDARFCYPNDRRFLGPQVNASRQRNCRSRGNETAGHGVTDRRTRCPKTAGQSVASLLPQL